MKNNAILLILSGLIALALGEIVSRFAYQPPDRTMETFRLTRSSAYQRDSELGWVPRPSFTGEHPTSRGKTFFSTNSLGLRDRDTDVGKTPGVERIVVLGDSFAWGWNVNDGEAFADLLEAARDDREVVNLGVAGYGLRQETLYFRRVGAAFAPDVVLLAFCMNDVVGTDSAFLDPRPIARTQIEDRPVGLARLKEVLSETSAMYGLVTDVINSNRGLARLAVRFGIKDELGGYDELDVNVRPFLKVYPEVLQDQWNVAMAELLELKALATSSNARFVIAIVPNLQSVDEEALERTLAYTRYEVSDFDLNRPYEALVSFAHRHAIEIIDPTPRFQIDHSRGSQLYLEADMHFNANGHRLFAEVVGGYLDGDRPPITRSIGLRSKNIPNE